MEEESSEEETCRQRIILITNPPKKTPLRESRDRASKKTVCIQNGKRGVGRWVSTRKKKGGAGESPRPNAKKKEKKHVPVKV